MKILMLTDLYPPSIGGAERHIETISRTLVKRGHKVIVCTLSSDGYNQRYEQNGVTIYKLGGFFQKMGFLYKETAKRYHPPIKDWLLARKIQSLLDVEKPDILHAHGWILLSGITEKSHSNTPICLTLHDYGFICPKKTLIKKDKLCYKPLTSECIQCSEYGLIKSLSTYLGLKLSNLSNKNIDLIFYTTPDLSERISFFSQKTIFLPNPVNTDLYQPIITKQHCNRILCWVKVEKNKGVDIIFETANRLPEWKFDMPFLGAEKDYYKKFKPDNVNFIPQLPYEEAPEFISKYPLVMGQFLRGVIGMAELEAMSCAKPVLAYWNRKHDNLYKNNCPILSSKEPDEIVNLIKSNAGNSTLGKINRQWVLENHSPLKIVNKLIDCYATLI